jgi:putative transposase
MATDRCLRQIMGVPIHEHMTSDLALDDVLTAVWLSNSGAEVTAHSNQGGEFRGCDSQDFLSTQTLLGSRAGWTTTTLWLGVCSRLLNHERIKLKPYTTSEQVSEDIFDSIEISFNPKRRQSHAIGLFPVEYE